MCQSENIQLHQCMFLHGHCREPFHEQLRLSRARDRHCSSTQQSPHSSASEPGADAKIMLQEASFTQCPGDCLGLSLTIQMGSCIAAGRTSINKMRNDSTSCKVPLAGLHAYEGAEAHHVHERTNRHYLFRIYLQATPTAYAKLSAAGKVYSSVNWTRFCVLDKASIGT